MVEWIIGRDGCLSLASTLTGVVVGNEELTDGRFSLVDFKKKKWFTGRAIRPECGYKEGPGKRGSAELPCGAKEGPHFWPPRAQQIPWLTHTKA